jgi:hypothetical protein
MDDIFRNKLRKYNKVSDITVDLLNYMVMNYMYYIKSLSQNYLSVSDHTT